MEETNGVKIAALQASFDAQQERLDALEAITLNSGDTAWILTCSCLVLMMTIPGLALFYGRYSGLTGSVHVRSVSWKPARACTRARVHAKLLSWSRRPSHPIHVSLVVLRFAVECPPLSVPGITLGPFQPCLTARRLVCTIQEACLAFATCSLPSCRASQSPA